MIRRCLGLAFIVFVFACSSTSSSTVGGGVDSGAAVDAPSDTASDTSNAPDVANDAASDTWPNYAAGFFTTYCTACHNAQDPTGRDYNVQANVAKDMAPMRCGVAAAQDPSWSCGASPVAKQFPIGSGPKPSDAERARIVAWITAGEP